MEKLIYFPYFVASIVLSTLLTWVVRFLADHYGLAVAPFSTRHLHRQPIPRLGGVAVFLAVVILVGAYVVAGQCGVTQPPVCRKLLSILMASLPIVFVGLYDDLKGIGPWAKLLAQAISGTMLYLSGIRLLSAEWHMAGPLLSSAVCLALTVLWVILISNAINLIDGVDGLAAGAALFSMVTIFAVASVAGMPGVALGTAILGGAVMGFLVFNFNPASIFLGDCGSLFVGFMLSSLVLAELPLRPAGIEPFLVPVISFALPLTDTVLSVLRRFLSGHALFGADREHIHHKLLEMGLTQRQVVFLLYGISALSALLSVFLLYGSHAMLFPVTSVVALFLFFGLRRLGYHEFAEFQRIWRRAGQQRLAFARNVAVRKVAAGLLHVYESDQLLDCLQASLIEDFDSFEIILDKDFVSYAGGILSEQDLSRTFRAFRPQEKIVLMLQLATPASGCIGELWLSRRVDRQTLIDMDLLMGDLRRSVAVALENCCGPTSASFVMSQPRESFDVRVSASGD